MTYRRQEHSVTVGRHGNERTNLAGIVAPPEWTVDALCAQVDPDLFFPEKGGSTREARRVCGMCPVQAQCLDFALSYESGEQGTATSYVFIGIYGGLSPQQRKAIVRERKASAA